MSLKQPDRVIGVADDNGPVWHGRSFHRDIWTMAGAEEPFGDGPVMDASSASSAPEPPSSSW